MSCRESTRPGWRSCPQQIASHGVVALRVVVFVFVDFYECLAGKDRGYPSLGTICMAYIMKTSILEAGHNICTGPIGLSEPRVYRTPICIR